MDQFDKELLLRTLDRIALALEQANKLQAEHLEMMKPYVEAGVQVQQIQLSHLEQMAKLRAQAFMDQIHTEGNG